MTNSRSIRPLVWTMQATVVLALIAGVAACTSSNAASTSSASSSSAPPSPTAASSTASSRASATSSSTRSPVPSSSHSTPAATGPSGGPVPAGFTPSSTTFVSADLGWVLGTAPCSHKPCTSVLRTRDGGSSWTGIPAPKAELATSQTTGAADDVSSIRFADASNGWAAGGALYSTHDGGATWVRQHIGPSGSAVSSLETGGGRVYAVVDACPVTLSTACGARFRVWTSPIGRDQWTQVAPKVAGNEVGDLVVHGSDWFLPTSAAVYHGSGAAAPTALPNPCPSDEGNRPSAELATADSTHLDAVCGSEGAAGTQKYQAYGTTDGGRHWTSAGGKHLLPSGLYGIADNARDVLLIALASGTSIIDRSTDDAAHFSNASVPDVASGGIAWADLGFTTPTQAVAVLVGKSMYLSHDAGAHFSRVHF